MTHTLYHNIICDIKACYPIRDRPPKRYHLKMTDITRYSGKNFSKKITENDLIELQKVFYGGKTHADCHFCKEAHHEGR